MRPWIVVWIAGLLTASLGAPALAGPLGESCRVGNRPAASLLLPYFEVDLAAADGTTTLVSIGNAAGEPILAHVVVWTDWGLPTLAFDLALGADQVQSLDLRAIFAGRFPVTGEGFGDLIDAPSCTFPIPPPPVDGDELRARHTGQPSPFSGLCYGSGRLGPTVATGYLTVDVVRDCSAGALPGDPGYFDFGGEGLATNDNVLYGELFLLASGDDLAQGIAAVSLVADAELFEWSEGDPLVPESFYDPWTDYDGSDNRAPLSSRHRARFLHGGGFDGTTDLLMWNAGVGGGAEARECGAEPDLSQVRPKLDFRLRDEAGEPLASVDLVPPAVAWRIPIGGEEIPVDPGSFGTVDVDATLLGCLILIPCESPMQSWVATLIGARGRFSVGLEATRLDDPCR